MTLSHSAWFAMLAIVLFVSAGAHASHCKHRAYSRAESEQLYGEASDVFVGVLERIDDESKRARSPGACQEEADESSRLDRIEATSGGWDRSDVVGTFRVMRRYKGADAKRMRVRINPGLRHGGRFLVYANSGEGELRADGYCWPRALPIGPNTEAYLAHLDHLPNAGRGAIDIGARTVNHGPAVAATTLVFASDAHRFAVLTGTEGFASTPSVPIGRYRLLSRAPAGHRYVCGDDPTCSALDVVDRGRTGWGISLQPQARLTIRLERADGTVVPVPATFALLDPQTGERRIWRPDPSYARPPSPGAQTGYAAPGDAVVVLELQRITKDGWRAVVTGNRRVFSGGASTLADAPVTTLADGDNVYRFVLPDTLRPVRTRIAFEGRARPYATLQLHGRQPEGHVAAIADADMSAATEHGFLALPGQTWRLGVYGHEVDERWLTPQEDGVVTIPVQAQQRR